MRLPLLSLLIACMAGQASATQPLRVFVSIAPQKYFVERIGGDRVDVQVMLDPGHAPETWEPSPRKIAALQEARLYFLIGVPFEHIWQGALPTMSAGLEIVHCCEEIAGAGGGDGHGHRDPHLWVGPAHARHIAASIRAALQRADPANREDYRRNYDALIADLDALEQETRELLADRRTPYFIISHASLGYFAEAYGLIQMAPESGGRAAGPRELAGIIERARREGISTVFVQRQFDSAAARTLVRELGARSVEIDPLAEDYLASMRFIAREIAAATH
jgi:zinc transport system substrate-binding protein